MAEVFPCLHSLLDNMLKCNELYALLHPDRLLFSVVAPMYCCNTKENEESLAGCVIAVQGRGCDKKYNMLCKYISIC